MPVKLERRWRGTGDRLNRLNRLARASAPHLASGRVCPARYGRRPASDGSPARSGVRRVEQVAFWFLNRNTLGLKINWPKAGIYQQFAAQDLFPRVTAVLDEYRPWTL